jgi:hypothetical protein
VFIFSNKQMPRLYLPKKLRCSTVIHWILIDFSESPRTCCANNYFEKNCHSINYPLRFLLLAFPTKTQKIVQYFLFISSLDIFVVWYMPGNMQLVVIVGCTCTYLYLIYGNRYTHIRWQIEAAAIGTYANLLGQHWNHENFGEPVLLLRSGWKVI